MSQYGSNLRWFSDGYKASECWRFKCISIINTADNRDNVTPFTKA